MSSFPRVLKAVAHHGIGGGDPDAAPSTRSATNGSTSRVLRQPPIGGLDLAPTYADNSIVDLEEAAYKRGIEESREAARQQLVSAANAMQTALEEGRRHLRREFDGQRDEIVAMAVDMADLITGHEHHDGGRALRARLNEALTLLDDSELVIAMNAVDLPLAGEIETQGITVVADPDLLPGEARITGRWAQADLTRAAAQDILREQLQP